MNDESTYMYESLNLLTLFLYLTRLLHAENIRLATTGELPNFPSAKVLYVLEFPKRNYKNILMSRLNYSRNSESKGRLRE